MEIVASLYFISVVLLALYGVHRISMVWRLVLFGYTQPDPPSVPDEKLPSICVQLPIYNERNVVRRLLASVEKLSYPRDRFEVQILDDSTDETSRVIDDCIKRWESIGINVQIIRRKDRHEYKAGALREGLKRTNAELIAIFDADFAPEPDFLRRLAVYFVGNPTLGMVQARWGHINRNESGLTRAQAILIDGHFVIEHALRAAAGVFFNFNGTAGVWRRKAILSAGGWSGDTLTEDLDLSYRAQLKGWNFLYLRDVICSGELPSTVSAFKSQQRRWIKGSAQVFRKLIWKILTSDISLLKKIEAFFHLSANFCYIFMSVAVTLFVPVTIYRLYHPLMISTLFELFIFIFTLGSMLVFYVYSQCAQGNKLKLSEIVFAIVLGIGMGIHCGMASLEGIMHRGGEFVRTPKAGGIVTGGRKRRGILDGSWIGAFLSNKAEGFFALYLLSGISYVLFSYDYYTVPFGFLLFAGYGYILLNSFRLDRR